MTVLVVGESLVDVVTGADGSTSVHAGGSPMNVAVGLGRLGLPVRLLTALGDDPHGTLLREHLAASGVEVLASPLAATSVAHAQLDGAGAATYSFELDWRLEVPEALPTPDWLHVGSVAVTQQPGAAVAAGLRGTTVSYDVNCRPALMGTPDRVLPLIEAQVSRSTVVKLSDEDAAWLHPAVPLEEVAQQWLLRGPAVVVATLGGDGAVAWTAEHSVRVAAADGGRVVDTVGAGDAFMAGLIWALGDLDIRRLSAPDLSAALTTAATVARRTCERPGADPPWRRDLP